MQSCRDILVLNFYKPRTEIYYYDKYKIVLSTAYILNTEKL